MLSDSPVHITSTYGNICIQKLCVWPIASTVIWHSLSIFSLSESAYRLVWGPCAEVCKCIRTFIVSLMKKCAESQTSIIKPAQGQGGKGQKDV